MTMNEPNISQMLKYGFTNFTDCSKDEWHSPHNNEYIKEALIISKMTDFSTDDR